jgi:rhodanese-related sulfurtransferase
MFSHAKLFRILPVAMLLILSPAGAKEKPLAPDSIPGAVKVNAESVLDLIESLPNLKIIDARMRQDRLHGYLEGSVSLPDIETDCKSLATILPKKSQPVLFYCNGPRCGRSVTSSRKALACGYTQIYWFRGGFEEWKQKQYPYVKE